MMLSTFVGILSCTLRKILLRGIYLSVHPPLTGKFPGGGGTGQYWNLVEGPISSRVEKFSKQPRKSQNSLLAGQSRQEKEI